MEGELSVPHLLSGMERIFEDPAVEPDMSYLHDWRGVVFSPSMDFRSLSGYARVQGEKLAGRREGARVAILLGGGEAYGITRQAVALLDQVTPAGIERRPFMDLDEACAWLGVDPRVVDGS